MKRAMCLIMILSLLPTAALAQEKKAEPQKPPTKAGELTDPLEILKKVDAAAKAVNAVKYNVTYEGFGAMEARGPKLKGKVITSGYEGGMVQKFLVDIEYQAPGQTEAKKVTGGTDADMFFVIDHQTKIAYQDIDPAVFGSFNRALMGAMTIEFVHPTPFSDEISGQSRELTGTESVGGEDCYVVHVVYQAEGAPEAVWHFSKKDFLPRARQDTYTLPDGSKGTMKRTITHLVVDPKISDDTFKLKLPEGYTKTDDFAP